MKVFAATGVIAALSLGPAVAQEPDVWIVGIGMASCAAWASDPQLDVEGQIWILGYWSGLNMVNGSMVGQSTDGLGIVERVKEVCRADPALRIADATAKVRADFREAGR